MAVMSSRSKSAIRSSSDSEPVRRGAAFLCRRPSNWKSGRLAAWISGVVSRISARSITLRNSRTLPGQ